MPNVLRDLALIAGVAGLAKLIYDRGKSAGQDLQAERDLALFSDVAAADQALMDMANEPYEGFGEALAEGDTDIVWVQMPERGWWSN